MSPISFNTFRTIPSNLDLNGPYLSFSKQPVSATTSGSFLELTGMQQFHFSKTQVQITLVLLHINGMRLVLDLSLKDQTQQGQRQLFSHCPI